MEGEWGRGNAGKPSGSSTSFPVPRSPFPVAGITLVELLVVLAVIGLLLGISVPAFTGYSKQVRLKTATQQVVGLVSLARSMAVSVHAEHAVVIDPERREVSVVNVASGQAYEKVVRLPSSVTVELIVGGQPASESRFVFRPTGALRGRTVSLLLTERDAQRAITVTGATGAISVAASQ